MYMYIFIYIPLFFRRTELFQQALVFFNYLKMSVVVSCISLMPT